MPFPANDCFQVGESGLEIIVHDRIVVASTTADFALRVEQGPWQTYETKENVEAHFNDVEAAWKAARGHAGNG